MVRVRVTGEREAARAGAPVGPLLRSVAIGHLVDAAHDLTEVRGEQQDSEHVQLQPQVDQEAWKGHAGR